MIICVIHVVFVLSVLITNTDSLQDGMHTPMISAPIPAEISPVVSAVLLECPKGSKQNSNASPRSKDSQGEQQLMVNIRVNPSFHIEKAEKFLILDEVYDPQKRTKAKIMSPYLIEISRGEPVMMYPLEFTKSVKLDSDKPQPHQTVNDTASSPEKIEKGVKTSEKTDKTDSSDKTEKAQSTVKIDKPEISPVQQSINRVIDKIADAIAPAIKIGPSPKKTRQGKHRVHDASLSSYAQQVNRDYSEEAVNREDQWRQNGRTEHKGKRQMSNSRRSNENKNLKEEPQLRVGYLTGYRKINQDLSEGGGQSSPMANVGVERKFVKQLEQQSNFNAYGRNEEEGENIGENVFNPVNGFDRERIHSEPEEIIKVKISKRGKETSKTFTDNNKGIVLKKGHDTPSVTSEEDCKQDHELIGTLIPLQSESETGTGIHEDDKEFNDEVNPRNYGQRSNGKLREKIYDKKRRDSRAHTKRRPMGRGMAYGNEDDFYNDNDSNEPYNGGSDKDRKQNVRNNINGYLCKHNQDAWHESESHELDQKETDSDDGDCEIQEEGQINNNEYKISEKCGNSKVKARQQNEDMTDDASEDNYEDYDYGNGESNQYLRMPQVGKQRFVSLGGRQNEPFADMNTDLFGNASMNKDQQLGMRGLKNVPQQKQQQWSIVPAPLKPHRNVNCRVRDWTDYDENGNNFDFRRSNNNNNRNNFGIMQLKNIQFDRDNVNGLRKSGIKDSFRNFAENREYEHQINGGNIKAKYQSNSKTDKISNYGGGHELKPNNYNTNELNRDLYAYGYSGNFETNKDTYDGQNILAYEKGGSQNYDPKKISSDGFGGTSYRLIPFYDIDLEPQSHVKQLKNFKESNSYRNEPSTIQLPPAESINSYYREKPTEISENFLNDYNNYGYHASMLPQAMNAAQDLINREPPQFLPPRVPFAKVIADPNLSTNDKVNMIEVMHPLSRQTDDKFHQMTQEMDRSLLMKPYPHPIPFPSPLVNIKRRKAPDNAKRKRSFLFYDDLEMRDTLSDNDYNFDNVEQKRSNPNSQRHAEDDTQPCSSCGGKNKKPPGKTDSVLPLQFNACECKNLHSSCSCGSPKTVRSVSDTWYSVFNMSAPLPFLTTKLQIFRKRYNSWWKIAPSITLSSLSGIFANANLSILFSSHVDIFQLEKSLRLQSHQLLIPKDDSPLQHRKSSMPSVNKARKQHPEDQISDLNVLNMNPNYILAIDRNKFSFTALETQSNAVEATRLNNDAVSYKEKMQKNSLREPRIFDDKRYRKRSVISGIQTIADLGYFPVSMNLLERCPNNKHRLCLNILDDKVPAYSIKVKMPFRENSIIIRNYFKVKIARIVTDATTKDALQVSVDIINEGLEAHEFSICVCNCAVPCSVTKSTVKKFLVPHIGETVNFLLPLITESNKKHKRYFCEGLLKAIFGRICSRRIDRCGFDFIQPGRGYEETSRCRRFFVNTFFFIVFPFVFWCKCFTPSEEDLLIASTEWQCSMAQESPSIASENEFYKNNQSSRNSDYSEDEDVLLAQHIDRHSKGSRKSKSSRGSRTNHKSKNSKSRERLGGGHDVHGIGNRLTDLSLAFHDGVFDDDDDEDEEVNTKFILKALVDSRESLKKLLRDPSNQQINIAEGDTSRLKEADEFVRVLKAAQIVYRSFDTPVGNARNIPYGIKYCVQGYFLPSLGAEYEFVNYNPMTQYRCISTDGRFVEILRPPVMLCPKEFSRTYANKVEVLEARDLYLQPPSCMPCINISTATTVATSVAKLASEHNYYKYRMQPLLALKDKPHSSVNACPSQELMLPLEEDETLTEENFTYSIDLEGQDPLDDKLFAAIDGESIPIIEDISEEVFGNGSHDVIEESLSIADDPCSGIRKYKCDTIYE